MTDIYKKFRNLEPGESQQVRLINESNAADFFADLIAGEYEQKFGKKVIAVEIALQIKVHELVELDSGKPEGNPEDSTTPKASSKAKKGK